MNNMFLKFLILMVTTFVFGSSTAHATFIFTDVSVTTHSVTFTLDGDTSGYDSIGSNTQFSIQYKGDLWAGLSTPSTNSWSSPVFDTHNFDHQGLTGIWASAWGYTWSRYDSSLATATASDRKVTVDLGNDFLNPDAIAGELVFVIGNGNSLYPSLTTVLGSFAFTDGGVTIPEPPMLLIFTMGLTVLLLVRRKKVQRSRLTV